MPIMLLANCFPTEASLSTGKSAIFILSFALCLWVSQNSPAPRRHSKPINNSLLPNDNLIDPALQDSYATTVDLHMGELCTTRVLSDSL